jgi:hypothetical protein
MLCLLDDDDSFYYYRNETNEVIGFDALPA